MSDLQDEAREVMYAPRDIIALGERYTDHIMAMTLEGLTSKSHIAAELAYRDAMIARLLSDLEAAEKDRDVYKSGFDEFRNQCDALVRALEEATKRAEAAEVDAARYQYLRDVQNEDAHILVGRYEGEELDAAVDAARAEQGAK